MKKQCLLQIMLGGILVAGLSIFNPQAWADDTAQLKDQVKALQEKVDQLESQLVNKQQPVGQALVPPSMPVVDPFAQMALIREQMQRNMGQAFANTEAFTPKTDMKQTDKEYLITMDIPGMDKDKINIEVKANMLVISGERHSETEDNKNNQYYQQQRSFGSFMQAVPLPEDARKDQIGASYKNGVLTVTVARVKKEEKRSENEKIKVQ